MKIVRTILMIINIVAIAGLLLSTLAGYLPPEKGVVASLLPFAYLPMLLLNILLAVIWVLMRRWQCLLSIAAIALRWQVLLCNIAPWGNPNMPNREAHPQMVSLMTFNVHQFRGNGNRYSPSDSCAREFVKLVRKTDADVLCLQEYAAVRTVNVTDSLTLLGYNHYYGVHTASTGNPYGTVVFSRFPITYVKRIDADKLMVEIMHPIGARFRVCCLHMESFQFDGKDREEMARVRHGGIDSLPARTIKKVHSTLVAHQHEWEQRVAPLVKESTLPLLLAGDMNDIPASWLYSHISYNLTDAFQEKGFGFGATYRGGLPRYRIDMVFRSEGWRTLSYKRLRSGISDHYPVLTSFELEI